MGTKTEIQQAPTVAAPSASQSAEDIFQARLKYDPLIAAQEFALQQQYMPQQAGLYSRLYGQYYPEYARSQQALQKELYPQQSQILERGATQAGRGLESAFGLAPQDPYQVGETERLRRQMRETRNIGGTLYGGRGYEAEDKGVEQLQQSFRQQALSNLIPYMQILYPQIGQQRPQISPYQFQSAVPGADQLYQAMYGASRPDYFASPGLGTQLIGLGGQLGSAKMMSKCISEGTIIDTQTEQKPIEDVKAGDIVYDKDNKLVKVLWKYEFAEPPTNDRFLELDFNDKKLVVCDLHKINGIRAKDLNVPKRFVRMDKRSYDLLTTGRDGSYRSNSIGIDSMIPELFKIARIMEG